MTPTLLFLPGAGGDPAFWRNLGDRLPGRWSKTYLGWPGLGAQEPDSKVNSFGDLVRLVEERLGDSPTDLLAQSMGGAVALRVALRRPTLIRRLVLTATSGGIDVASLGAADWRADYRAAFPHAAPWITAPAPDYSAELFRITQPVLLVWGDADPISPVKVGEKLRTLLPNATLHVVRGGDHDLANVRAPELVEPITRFLSE